MKIITEVYLDIIKDMYVLKSTIIEGGFETKVEKTLSQWDLCCEGIVDFVMKEHVEQLKKSIKKSEFFLKEQKQ